MSQEIVAYVLAGCTCGPAMQAIDTGHADSCPVRHDSDLGWYIVSRAGETKKAGGTGVLWTCSCWTRFARNKPHSASTCTHMRALYAGRVVEVSEFIDAPAALAHRGGSAGSKPYIVKLTPFGADLLKADWAARALKTQ